MNFSIGGDGGGLLTIFILFGVGMIILVVAVTALRWWANGGQDKPGDAEVNRDEDNAMM